MVMRNMSAKEMVTAMGDKSLNIGGIAELCRNTYPGARFIITNEIVATLLAAMNKSRFVTVEVTGDFRNRHYRVVQVKQQFYDYSASNKRRGVTVTPKKPPQMDAESRESAAYLARSRQINDALRRVRARFEEAL